ncbi:MAG: electron transfer flavoprotein subunit beta/FixA family protein [Chloroflexi bacterium]|nr:electron transfer flavoprotein subunit beta/FixA family protein [Chloroflexota bacterium]
MLKIAVLAKEVPDSDIVDAMSFTGRLQVDSGTMDIRRDGIVVGMNSYDAQAVEAAMRLRDAGVECTIRVLSVGGVSAETTMFRRAFALGADEGYHLVDSNFAGADSAGTARVLAAAIRHLGGADLVLCGRQGTDYDQGVVGPTVAALLGMPFISVAKDVQIVSPGVARVVRVTPEGEETVDAELPAVVTVSSELGKPRYPTSMATMAARRKKAVTLSSADIGLNGARIRASAESVRRVKVAIPQHVGACQFLEGDSAAEVAAQLAQALRKDGVI